MGMTNFEHDPGPLALSLLAAVLLVGTWPSEVDACQFVESFHGEFEVSEGTPPQDTAAPGTPSMELEGINRGVGPVQEGCGQASTSCDDLGSIRLTLADFDAEQSGMLFEVRGDLPEGVVVPTEQPAVVATDDILLGWVDGATDDQEPIAFEIRAIAVDQWGQQSEPSDWVLVEDPGGVGSAGGCSVVATGFGAGPLLLLFALGITRRRARRRN